MQKKKKKKHNIPPLRLAGFTEEWEEKKLGEIGVTYTGLSGKSKQDFGHGNATFITYLNVYVNPLANKLGVDKVEIDQSQNEVKSGDILFTTSSETPEEVGMSSVWLYDTPNTYLNSFCFGYRPSININPYFSASLFRSPGVREDFKLLAQGISRFNISKQKAMELEVSLPSLKEQEQIGAFFRALDELIGAKEEELEKLRQMKAALLEAMFPNDEKQTNVNGGYKCIDIKHLPEGFYLSEGSADTPRLRFRGFTEPWQRKKLGEVVEVAGDKNINGVYGRGEVLSVSDDRGVTNQVALLGRSFAGASMLNYKVLKYGEIVYTKSPLRAKPYGIIKENTEETGIVSVLYAVYKVREKYSASFIHYYFDPAWRINKYLRPLVNIGAKNTMNISDTTILIGELSFPSPQEQERIGEFFRGQDEGIASVGEQIERLRAMKQAYLERMFA